MSNKTETIQILQTTIGQLQRILDELNSSQEYSLNSTALKTLVKTTENLTKPKPKPPKALIVGVAIALVISLAILFIPRESPSSEVATNTPIIETPTPQEVAPTPEQITPIPLATPTILPPPPKLEIIPQQPLIAAIQEQVAAITDKYTQELINSVEANFLSSRLIIKVGDSWQELDPNNQQKIADEILQQCQKLDFRKLEIYDTQDHLLARSPVVGKSMLLM